MTSERRKRVLALLKRQRERIKEVETSLQRVEVKYAHAVQESRHLRLERDEERRRLRCLANGRVVDSLFSTDIGDEIVCYWRVSKRVLKLHKYPEIVWETVFRHLKEELYKAHANLT